MKKLRHFRCSESKATIERFVKDDELVVKCKCDGLASRLLSAPRCFSNSATCQGKSHGAR